MDTILEALEADAKYEMKQGGIRVREHVLKENGSEASDAVVDTAVSFDERFWTITCLKRMPEVLKKSQCQSDKEFEECQIEHLASSATQ